MASVKKKLSESPDVETIEELKHNEGRSYSVEDEKKIVRKIDVRILPFTALIYLLRYLDRSNIGNARILNSNTGDDLLDSTGLTTYQYTISLMLFFTAYCAFEAPSNLAMKVLQPNRWLGFIVVTFGAICAGIGGVHNYAGIAALRFLLGAAEGGVFPGMIFHLSFWYKPEERATRIAVFLCSATLAGAFGGAIAFGVGHINGAGGLEGWRWLFVIEGIPTVILGICVFLFMPSYPEKASWLSEHEKRIQIERLGTSASHGEEKLNWNDAKATLKDFKLWIHYITYLCAGAGVSSLSLFAPVIVSGLGYKDLNAQLFTIPPYAVAYVVTLAMSILSDRKKMRGPIACAGFVMGSISFIILATVPGTSFRVRYAFLCFAASGVFGCLPALCAWVSDNVHNTTAGSLASALNIAFTGPGQIIGVWIYRAQDSPVYRLGHAVNAGLLGVGALLSFGLWLHYTRLNKGLVGTGAMRWVS